MFGMGGSEIIVILIVALLFLGPDKLPQAAKTISKGIRDIKKQSRSLQQQIEGDEQIGGAIRDLKSALRGEDEPRSIPPPKREIAPPTNTIHAPDDPNVIDGDAKPAEAAADQAALAPGDKAFSWLPEREEPAKETVVAGGKVTFPATAGEADADGPPATSADDEAELAAMIKPASGTVAKGS